MSRAVVHVLVPHTIQAACGQQGFSRNGLVRVQITCRKCKEHPLYKQLPLGKRK